MAFCAKLSTKQKKPFIFIQSNKLSPFLEETFGQKERIMTSFEDLLNRLKTIDIPQQELVQSYEMLTKKYEGEHSQMVLSEFIEVCLTYHFNTCDILRLDFFQMLKKFTKKKDSLKCLILLTREGKDLRHFEHDIAKLVAEWIENECKSLDHDKMNNSDRESLISFVSNLVKFSFPFIAEESLVSIMNSILLICSKDVKLTSAGLNFVDSLLRFGVITDALLPLFLKFLISGLMEISCSTSAHSIIKNLMVSTYANLVVDQTFSFLNSDTLQSNLGNAAMRFLLFIYQHTDYESYGISRICQVF
jgi:hypothetical protein